MSLQLTKKSDELYKDFYALKTSRDVARLLDVKYDRLIYHLHKTDRNSRYETFEIPKKSGGSRKICAPVTALKIIQRKLNQVLQGVYPKRPQVHGFVEGKSILSNASQHSTKYLVLKLDLKDFFPSINFGRVRGMFQAYPYKLNADVATILSQICCFDNHLPQGAPTSPIVSNMICAKMDSELLQLAKRNRCTYTRYADDLTFSTSDRKFAPSVARFRTTNSEFNLGTALERIIAENGFEINRKKLNLLRADRRQMVTGLITNKFPNVKRSFSNQIRAMLYAWEKHGLASAEKHFRERHYKKHRLDGKVPPFLRVIQGRIEFLGYIRGRNNPLYIRYRDKLYELAKDLISRKEFSGSEAEQHVLSFPNKQIDAYQLTCDIEDILGLRLRPHTESSEADGSLVIMPTIVTIEHFKEEKQFWGTVTKRIPRALTSVQKTTLRKIYEEHVPQELTFQGEMGQVVTRYSPSVGRVIVSYPDGVQKYATGFLVAKRNLILTAFHVVDPKKLSIEFVEFEKQKVRAKIIFVDESMDLAILELEQEILAWPLEIRQPLQIPRDRGMRCVTIGYPDEPGYEPRSVPIELTITGITGNYLLKQEVLTLDRVLGSGTSGSPILNKNRSLVGMVLGYPSEGEQEQDSHRWTAAAVSCNGLAPIIRKFK